MKYGGENNKDGIVKWMKNPTAPKQAEVELPWSEIENDVVHLTTETFDSFISSNPSVLVMFYAPWCGHCKKMKPEYEEAASILKQDKVEGMLAAVDATKEKDLGDKYNVKGFPTVKYFQNSEEAWDFNERTASKIVEFMKDPQEPPPPPPPEPAWQDIVSEVHHLTDDTFKPFLKKKKHTLVMFYAPWCGHCKKAKPEFASAAEKLKDEPKIAYAAVDCTTHTTTCGEHDVNGYPTFKYFNYGKNSMKYTGGREEVDFLNFMKDPQNSLTSPPAATPSPAIFWSDAPGHEHLHHLSDQNFDIFVKAHRSVLVLFYASWCGHCKALRPAYAEAGAILKEIGNEGVLATVDASQERSLSGKYEIRNGQFESDYNKGRKTGDLVAFMKSRLGEGQEKWSDTPSKVFHLTKETFSDFLSQRSNVLVMFYAPWCPHCKKAKPEYQAAAEVLSQDTNNKYLAAVDCTDTQDLCLQQDVSGYPTFKFYRHGHAVVEYDGSRSKDDFIEYMKKQETDKIGDETVTSGEFMANVKQEL
ncbi:hypothetical protein LSH36_574g01051 [Paralvinella palmiformis]|uniref:Thioredoxin domain-containing protein n=1 Tax=Paralvinella palmiformis TaxID=53620 RepID=A0AAD9MV67_9ANNE|nr:hypothetical protein LSH36_574g01051 [Paralvinella palmiformis]